MSRRSRHGRRPQQNAPDAPDALEPDGVSASLAIALETGGAPDRELVGTGQAGSDSHAAVAPAAALAVPPAGRAAPPMDRPVAPSRGGETPETPIPGVPVALATGGGVADAQAPRSICTQAQLRRFIKSRPWIPMHELRRRFGISGEDDDVTPVRTASGTIFVGLPEPEGRLLGELIVGGDVGYELGLDPGAPIVMGVYPMRPVPRG